MQVQASIVSLFGGKPDRKIKSTVEFLTTSFPVKLIKLRSTQPPLFSHEV